MLSKEELLHQLEASNTELLTTLAAVPPQNFNRGPEGKWSPGSIAEHLLILETLVNRILLKAHPTERAPDLKVEPIKAGLRDQGRKLEAPAFIHPTGKEINQQEVIAALAAQRKVLKEILEQHDITETADEKHPVIGSMTRLEWTLFNIYHAERHLGQIKAMGV